jgi:hypothetical protein
VAPALFSNPSGLALDAETPHHVRPIDDRHAPVQRLADRYPAARQRSAPGRAFDLPPALAPLSRPGAGTKAFPFSAAGTLNLRFISGMKRSRKERLASSTVCIPARRSSGGHRPCQVPKRRSLRPRAGGE